MQVADHAVWQRAWLRGGVLAALTAYWRHQLADGPARLELPVDRPRTAGPAARGGRVEVVLPAPLRDSLRAVARRCGGTLFMTLLAAFQAQLYRYSGQRTVLIGSPIAGRTRLETEGLIGFFVNTLVLRGDLAGDLSFADLLGRARETTLGAYAHQDLPFEKLVQELHPERELGQAPLFQVMLALQNAPAASPEASGLAFEALPAAGDAVQFDLTLDLAETSHGLSGALEYDRQIFDRATVHRMTRHLGRLLRDVAAHAERQVAHLDLLAAAERAQLLGEWNDTAVRLEPGCLVHQLFEEQVTRRAEAVAAIAGGRTLSYGDLDARANALGRLLEQRGVRAEVLVGLHLERSLEMAVAVLAVLKAGGAYVPLDPAHPGERLAWVLADAGVSLVLTRGASSMAPAGPPGLPESVTEVIAVDDSAAGHGSGTGAPPQASRRREPALRTAYVIYTSGSTGRPKGVAIPHRALVNHCRAMGEAYALRGGDRVLQFASPGFDVAFEEMLPTWSRGGAVFFFEPSSGSMTGFSELVEARRLSVLNLPASFWQEWVADLDRAGRRPPDSLRLVVAGSEAIAPTALEKWRRLETRRVDWHNAYGLTEVTITSTLSRRGSVLEPGPVVPIGRPITNLRVYVVDRHLAPVPQGAAGELYFAGEGLGRGYLCRPALTAERFLPDPFAARPGERLYRTGDLVRWSRRGDLEFLGRADQQIKVRGFRIEPGEVEAALTALPEVTAAAVAASGEGAAGRRLVAYLVPEGAAPTAAVVQRGLSGRLPPHMVPERYVVLDALPLTASGKIDRRRLPQPAAERPGDRVYTAPRSPLEEILAGVWADVLEVPEVGIHDNFFELGGHSLLATQMLSRVRDLFHVDLPLRSVFEQPDVASLAAAVEAAEGESGSSPASASPLAPAGERRPGEHLPLSFAQERLWFLDRFEPGTAHFNLPGHVRLHGLLRIALLDHCLNAVVARHESLRTVFDDREGRPFQLVEAPRPVPMPVIDLAALAPAAREAEVRRAAGRESREGFDLVRGPLLRASLVRLSPAEHVLLLTLHHIIADGWSLGILVRDLGELYGALLSGSPPALPQLRVHVADHAVWQRRWLSGRERRRQLAFWRRQLAGELPALDLPTDRLRSAERSFRGATASLRLAADLSDRLRRLAQGHGASLFMVLLAALKVLLQRLSAQDDILVGTPVAGRQHSELESVVGLFLNTLVLRSDLSSRPTLVDLLARLRATASTPTPTRTCPSRPCWRSFSPTGI